MAFVVEDGTGLSNSNSFCDVAFYRTYLGDMGDTTATAKTDSDIQFALVKGTAYITETYRTAFSGRKAFRTQALPFPRYGAQEDSYRVEPNVIPLNLKKATCEAAKRSFTNDLFKDVKPGDSSVIEKSIGPITKRWAPGAYQSMVIYPVIEKLLAGLLNETWGVIRTIRS
jgi:hypothetical protein